MLYAVSAWWGFTTASDKHCIEAFVRRGVRLQLYSAVDPTPTQLSEDADKTLFSRIKQNPRHVLYRLLPVVINIVCAVDGITSHYPSRQMTGTL